ncbi:hypothetical protein E4T56_gene305 [Termitomyces sp. T112]|nr:hypothetical protein E4T56_gene305 [Termitomyces sp. T112]
MSSSAARCLLSISVPANKHLPPQAPAAADTDATGGTFEFLPALDLPYYNSLFVLGTVWPMHALLPHLHIPPRSHTHHITPHLLLDLPQILLRPHLPLPSFSQTTLFHTLRHLIEYQTRTRRTPEKPTPAYTSYIHRRNTHRGSDPSRDPSDTHS